MKYSIIEAVIKNLIQEISIGDPESMMRIRGSDSDSSDTKRKGKYFPSSSREDEFGVKKSTSEKKFDLIRRITGYIESEMGEMTRGSRDSWVFHINTRYGGKRMLPRIVARVEKMIELEGDPSITVDYDIDTAEIFIRSID